MQKTNFNFELLIGEDNSSDNTRTVCLEYTQKYPHIIRLLSSEKNVGMIPNFIRSINSCTGKYIAICEGDDYWTDPFKLQKQVDFLEANSDFALVHTNKSVLRDNTLHIDGSQEIKSGNIFEDLLFSPLICTLTVLVRAASLKNVIINVSQHYEKRKWKMLDYPLWLEVALNNKIAYLKDDTGVYRFLDESACHSKNNKKAYTFDKSIIDIKEFYYKKYLKINSNIDIRFKLRFNENIFHAKKRLFLDYRILAINDLLELLLTNPLFYFYLILKKIKRS